MRGGEKGSDLGDRNIGKRSRISTARSGSGGKTVKTEAISRGRVCIQQPGRQKDPRLFGENISQKERENACTGNEDKTSGEEGNVGGPTGSRRVHQMVMFHIWKKKKALLGGQKASVRDGIQKDYKVWQSVKSRAVIKRSEKKIERSLPGGHS